MCPRCKECPTASTSTKLWRKSILTLNRGTNIMFSHFYLFWEKVVSLKICTLHRSQSQSLPPTLSVLRNLCLYKRDIMVILLVRLGGPSKEVRLLGSSPCWAIRPKRCTIPSGEVTGDMHEGSTWTGSKLKRRAHKPNEGGQHMSATHERGNPWTRRPMNKAATDKATNEPGGQQGKW